jgi:hypothetical protein
MKTFRYHTLENSSSRITRAALDADTETIYLEFPNASYSYHRPGEAIDIFDNLCGVKDHAKFIEDQGLTADELEAHKMALGYKIGSEGSYCLAKIVGPRTAYFPNVKLSPEEASEVFPVVFQAGVEPCEF